jgi:hypothetical protein
VGKVF